MPAYYDSGFVTFEPAWHTLAPVLDFRPETFAQARKLADLEWDIERRDLFELQRSTATFTRVPDYFQLKRSDTGALLAVHQDSYEPISNAEFGQVIEYVMEGHSGLQPQFDTLISMKGGRLIAATLDLGVWELPGDPSGMRTFVVFYTSHDRSTAFQCGQSTIRIVCANTQAAAQNELERNDSAFTFKHTANWKERVDDVKDALALALKGQQRLKDMAGDLIALPVRDIALEEFVDKWIPYSTDMTDVQMANVLERRAIFMDVYSGERGQETMEGIRGTKWGVYQAAVQTCDHHSEFRTMETLTRRTLIHGDDRKAKALRVLAQV